MLVADGTVCVHYFIIPLCHVRTLEIEPLVYAQVIARTIAVVCYLAFEQRFVTQLSGNFEQLVEVVVETESTVLDDVIGQCLHLCIVSFQQIDAGGQCLGGEGCHGSLVFHLVGTHAGQFVDGVVQIFQHIIIYGLYGRTAKIGLQVVTVDDGGTEIGHQTIVGPCTDGTYFAAIGFVGFVIFASCSKIFGITVEALQGGIGDADDVVEVHPYLVQCPE